jgi:hypothetical protein
MMSVVFGNSQRSGASKKYILVAILYTEEDGNSRIDDL